MCNGSDVGKGDDGLRREESEPGKACLSPLTITSVPHSGTRGLLS